MPKFKKRIIKRKSREIEPFVYKPENVGLNEDITPLAPPTTEYESRRCSVGRDAIRQITGK